MLAETLQPAPKSVSLLKGPISGTAAEKLTFWRGVLVRLDARRAKLELDLAITMDDQDFVRMKLQEPPPPGPGENYPPYPEN